MIRWKRTPLHVASGFPAGSSDLRVQPLLWLFLGTPVLILGNGHQGHRHRLSPSQQNPSF